MQSTGNTRQNPYAQQDASTTSFDTTAKDSNVNLADNGMSSFYSEVRPTSRIALASALDLPASRRFRLSKTTSGRTTTTSRGYRTSTAAR